MDPRLLDYYNQELIYMRELAGEFAQAHPKIARRLGMQAGEVADPYVERLIESFCFMAARVQIKLDAEFPRFTRPPAGGPLSELRRATPVDGGGAPLSGPQRGQSCPGIPYRARNDVHVKGTRR